MRLTVVAGLLALTACAHTTQDMRLKADALAATAQMHAVEIPAGMFTLMAYERIGDANGSVHVYIEGDGNAWLTSNMVSPDPTPLDPVSLKLAVQDHAPNVVYLARVCQYVMSDACNPKYWTHAQFSETTIASYQQVMDRWKGHPLELTGFSGGAAVALLVAARRNDVVALRTVAGEVDTEAFTALHHISPLSNSLNPASVIERTAMIPQIHFTGDNDRVVPPSLTQGYQSRMPAGHCSRYEVVSGVDHYSGWPEQWAGLLAKPLPCRK